MTGPDAERGGGSGGGGDERGRDATRPGRDHDEVDESSEESFPASDPPSWEPLHSGTPDRKPAPERDGGAGSRQQLSPGLGGQAFGAHLAGLEERVAAADARGEAVPSEARAMITHLREIVDALDGLTASLGRGSPPGAAQSPQAASPDAPPPPPSGAAGAP